MVNFLAGLIVGMSIVKIWAIASEPKLTEKLGTMAGNILLCATCAVVLLYNP